MAKGDAKRIIKDAEEAVRLEKLINQQKINELNTITSIFSIESQREKLKRKYMDAELSFASLAKKIKEEEETLNKKSLTALHKKLSLLGQIKTANKANSDIVEGVLNTIERTGKVLKNTILSPILYNDLQQADAAMKSVALSLGSGSENSEILRDNMMQTATYAARLGATMSDIGSAQLEYADETGRALSLNEDNLKAIIDIGKGTGLGIQQAGRLGAQFENIGLNARRSAEFVESIVDSSERMGVNATKVLKSVNDNFKLSQRFTFRQGVKGLADMAMYSSRFKTDMTGVFEAMENTRSLEGAVDMAAQLQVLGGEFAKSDPFEMLFLSRNDPAGFQERLNQMIKGVSTLKKTAEGFEFTIAPMDRDRLRIFAEQTGQDFSNVVEQANRFAEIQRANQMLLGSGFSKDERKFITDMAQFQSKTGRFNVEIDGKLVDIASLSKDQVRLLGIESKTLQERALASQTFDDVLKNTMMEFKATLLPMLKGVNKALELTRQVTDWFRDSFGDHWTTGVAQFGTFAGIFLAGSKLFGIAMAKWNTLNPFASIGGGKTKGGGPMMGPHPMSKGGAGMFGGVGGALAGAGIAGAGIGAGIKLASDGISDLAESFKELNETKIDKLNTSLLLLGGTVLGGLAAGTIAVGVAGKFAAPGLLAVGAAALGIGAGIGIAALGVSTLTDSLNGLSDPNIGDNMLKISGSVAALSLGLASMVNPASLIGMVSLQGILSSISDKSGNLDKLNNTIMSIVSLKNSGSELKQLEKTINSIVNMKLSDKNPISELSSLLKHPLKVEFDKKEVALNVDLDVNLDGNRIASALNIRKRMASLMIDAHEGKGGAFSLSS